MTNAAVSHPIGNFFKDKDGKIAVIQWPNVLLWTWVISSVALRILKPGRPYTGFMFLAEASIFAWAYLEITSGLSPFRRVLGALILIATVVSHFR